MTDFDKYLQMRYDRVYEEIEKSITIKACEEKDRIRTVLGRAFEDDLDAIFASQGENAFQGYKKGFTDGIRFLLSVSTS